MVFLEKVVQAEAVFRKDETHVISKQERGNQLNAMMISLGVVLLDITKDIDFDFSAFGVLFNSPDDLDGDIFSLMTIPAFDHTCKGSLSHKAQNLEAIVSSDAVAQLADVVSIGIIESRIVTLMIRVVACGRDAIVPTVIACFGVVLLLWLWWSPVSIFLTVAMITTAVATIWAMLVIVMMMLLFLVMVVMMVVVVVVLLVIIIVFGLTLMIVLKIVTVLEAFLVLIISLIMIESMTVVRFVVSCGLGSGCVSN